MSICDESANEFSAQVKNNKIQTYTPIQTPRQIRIIQTMPCFILNKAKEKQENYSLSLYCAASRYVSSLPHKATTKQGSKVYPDYPSKGIFYKRDRGHLRLRLRLIEHSPQVRRQRAKYLTEQPSLSTLNFLSLSLSHPQKPRM